MKKYLKIPFPTLRIATALTISPLGIVLMLTTGPHRSQAQDTSYFVQQNKIVEELLVRGRAQVLKGDYDSASKTFKEIEARDANNVEAKRYSTLLAEMLGSIHSKNIYKTRAQMLTEVEQQWERPKVFDIADKTVKKPVANEVQSKLTEIIIPQVNFSGIELARVIETLSELSLEYDDKGIGVNIVPLFNPNENNPRVNISLRNLSLDRILQFVTQQVNFTYEVGIDAVTVTPSFGPAGGQSTVTEFFPISGGTVIRLTGFGDSSASSGVVDPFDPSSSGNTGPSSDEKTDALKNFFQRAGVNFETPGAGLAFDGQQLIVTQTRQNIDRMRTILRNYSEIKQVEIEAKFLEVAQSDLEEFGFEWDINKLYKSPGRVGGFQSRSLSQSYANFVDSGNITISKNTPLNTNTISVTNTIDPVTNNILSTTNNQTSTVGFQPSTTTTPNPPPVIPLAGDFALGAADAVQKTFRGMNFLNGNYDIDLAIRALSRKTGTDLMSAPKITVLSGKRATITIAQELRYPEKYSPIESNTGGRGKNNNNNNDTGSSSISITAGTPEDFTVRNIGVELSVLPNVENDDTISLVLEPKVTEFEGFVEYGGPSIAISGDTTVTVPSGFYQPIFSTREIATEVTVFDGATLVMGGLTRDEIRTVKDKLPILGDIPGLGRLFRSEGETRQKRNLLIFVTANLVSPGGSLSRQNLPNAKANELFQNPVIITPSGSVNRTISTQEK